MSVSTIFLDAPLWMLEPITRCGIKILPLIVELPNHDMLRTVDSVPGEFDQAIVRQLIPIVQVMRGRPPPKGFLTSVDILDKEPPLKADGIDVVMIQFQKHYANSTKNVTLIDDREMYTEQLRWLLDDRKKTNVFFKSGTFVGKIDLRITMIRDELGRNIYLSFYEFELKKEFTEEEVSRVKSIIY